MTSKWTLPTIISQYPEADAENFHISWLETDNFAGLKTLDKISVRTTHDLVHIARDPRHDILQKTYYLKITGFDFSTFTGPVTGIEMRMTMNRGGRITDDTVQLCLGNKTIGKNLASLPIPPVKVYGGDSDTWENKLSVTDIQDPTFGITLRFQSHPMWPHKSSPLIDAVELRIH